MHPDQSILASVAISKAPETEALLSANLAAPILRPDEYQVLDNIQRRVLWLSTLMIHQANNVRPNPDGIKIGGHQASSASMVSILTALYFRFLQPGDRVSVKPHAS